MGSSLSSQESQDQKTEALTCDHTFSCYKQSRGVSVPLAKVSEKRQTLTVDQSKQIEKRQVVLHHCHCHLCCQKITRLQNLERHFVWISLKLAQRIRRMQAVSHLQQKPTLYAPAVQRWLLQSLQLFQLHDLDPQGQPPWKPQPHLPLFHQPQPRFSVALVHLLTQTRTHSHTILCRPPRWIL